MKRFITRCHKLGCSNRKMHNPEISITNKTLKEALISGRKMMDENKTHVYINWRKGNTGYLVNYPTGRVDRRKLRK